MSNVDRDIIEGLLKSYRKNILNTNIDLDLDYVLSTSHLHAIITDEFFTCNNHSQIIDNSKPVLKRLMIHIVDDDNYRDISIVNDKSLTSEYWWVHVVSSYTYDPAQVEKGYTENVHRDEIIKTYGKLWQTLAEVNMGKPNAKFVIDFRSLQMKGPDLFILFSPFIRNDCIEVLESKHDIKELYISSKKPYISRVRKNEKRHTSLTMANITFIFDEGFMRVRDEYSTLLLASLSVNYKLYYNKHKIEGKDSFQYIFQTYKVKLPDELIEVAGVDSMQIRIPDTKVKINLDNIGDSIPDKLRPYILNY